MKKNVRAAVEILAATYPGARIELDFGSVFQLLVAVILSAQCTDKRVNMVTPHLFGRFPDAAALAAADLSEIEELIHSTGFFRAKARNIQGAARMIVSDFGGEVPSSMAELLKLPGVARKTANVVLWSGFARVEGIVVDTHVLRVGGLLGWIPSRVAAKKQAVAAEKILMELLPRKFWGVISHLLILHGRRVCVARRPKCGACPLNEVCAEGKKRLKGKGNK